MNLREVEHYELTDFQYAEAGKGPWRLYIYNRNGVHSAGQWFVEGKIKYVDEEILIADAQERADAAIAEGREVRVTDSGDMLVFHSTNGEIVYGKTFWNEVKPDPNAVKVANRLKSDRKGK